ncbi:MAG: zinc ribbon domain-containing protein [Bradymonadaceae bacterium]
MITCPNCGKPVAEDVVHCGHCGHRMDHENKKTMLGMAAINADELQRAIAEAKTGDDQSTDEPKPAAPKPAAPKPAAQSSLPKPKLKIPTPGQGPSSASSGGSPFSLPKPSTPAPSTPAETPSAETPAPSTPAETPAADAAAAEAKTVMLPQVQSDNPPPAAEETPKEETPKEETPKDTFPDSPPNLIGGAPPQDEPERLDNDFSEDAFAPTIAGRTMDELSGAPENQPHLTPSDPAPTPAPDAPLVGDPMPGAPVPDGMLPDGVPAGAPAGPGLDPYAPAPEMMVQPDQAVQPHAAGDMIPGEEEPKSKKKLFMILGGIAFVMFSCCIFNVIYFLVF